MSAYDHQQHMVSKYLARLEHEMYRPYIQVRGMSDTPDVRVGFYATVLEVIDDDQYNGKPGMDVMREKVTALMDYYLEEALKALDFKPRE